MKFTTIGGATAMAGILMGCSVHSQAPIQQVAYDFSDYDHYDRAHGASPDYAQQQQAGGTGVVVEIHQAPPAEAEEEDDGESLAPAPRPARAARAAALGTDTATAAMTPVRASEADLGAAPAAGASEARASAASARAPAPPAYYAAPSPVMLDEDGEPVAVAQQVYQEVHEVHQHTTDVRVTHAGPAGYVPAYGNGYYGAQGYGPGYGVVVGRPVGYPPHGIVVLPAPIHGVPVIPRELRRSMGLGSKDRPQVVYQPVVSRPALR
jgi:hypothetical protein